MHWLEPGDVPNDLLQPYAGDRITGWWVIDGARESRVPVNAGSVKRQQLTTRCTNVLVVFASSNKFRHSLTAWRPVSAIAGI